MATEDIALDDDTTAAAAHQQNAPTLGGNNRSDGGFRVDVALNGIRVISEFLAGARYRQSLQDLPELSNEMARANAAWIKRLSKRR